MNPFPAVLLVLLTLPGILTAQKTYDVRLTYPRHAGQEFGLTSRITRSQNITISVNDVVVKEDSATTRIDFDGMIKINQVNADAQPSNADIRIQSFLVTIGDTEEDVFPAGTIINVQELADGRIYYSVGGEPVKANAEALLASLNIIDKEAKTTEAIFGTAKPVAAGETWSINTDEALKSAARSASNIALEDISGEMTLHDVERRDGQKVMKVTGSMTIKNLRPDELPPEMSIEHGTLRLKASGILPVDSDNGPLEQSGSMTLKLTASHENEQGVLLMTSDMIEDRREVFTFTH